MVLQLSGQPAIDIGVVAPSDKHDLQHFARDTIDDPVLTDIGPPKERGNSLHLDTIGGQGIGTQRHDARGDLATVLWRQAVKEPGGLARKINP